MHTCTYEGCKLRKKSLGEFQACVQIMTFFRSPASVWGVTDASVCECMCEWVLPLLYHHHPTFNRLFLTRGGGFENSGSFTRGRTLDGLSFSALFGETNVVSSRIQIGPFSVTGVRGPDRLLRLRQKPSSEEKSIIAPEWETRSRRSSHGRS